MTGEEFIDWEKNAWGIDYKPEYTDLAGGDIEAGLLLSQIVYWYLPANETGARKLRVHRDGMYWIARKRGDWWLDTRLLPHRIDRAVRILHSRNLVIYTTFHFERVPTLHICLLESQFLHQLEAVIKSLESQGHYTQKKRKPRRR